MSRSCSHLGDHNILFLDHFECIETFYKETRQKAQKVITTPASGSLYYKSIMFHNLEIDLSLLRGMLKSVSKKSL